MKKQTKGMETFPWFGSQAQGTEWANKGDKEAS